MKTGFIEDWDETDLHMLDCKFVALPDGKVGVSLHIFRNGNGPEMNRIFRCKVSATEANSMKLHLESALQHLPRRR